jgi:KaiC/GvpD/RAD55 family RecA-like ATPase
MSNKWNIDLSYPHNEQCPRCAREGRDSARDNLQVYSEGNGAYCHACGWTLLSDEEKAKRGIYEEEEDEQVSTRDPITDEENATIKGYTGTKSKGWRGIKDETNKYFGIRYEYDEETGEPDAQYVPTTINGKLVGYKVRRMPKDFSGPVGVVGKDCDLVGQFRFTNGGRVVVIVGGEVDQLSAYQMLAEYQESKGYDAVPVVSPTVGETGCVKQIQAQYEWFNKFDRIIIGMDNDAAGETATHKIAKVLPKGKVYVAKWSRKDPNLMLTSGLEKEFVNNYFKAKPYTPDGIVGSSGLGDKIREAAGMKKIPLPPFMHKLQKMMAGGFPLKTIINLGSASGTGKSTIVDEMTYYWIFNSPYKVGIVTLESDSGQYGTKILSRHVGRKIDLIEDETDKLAYLDSDYVREKEKELYFMPDGTDRFYLIEDRDGGLESMKAKIEELIIACGCQLIILDPLQDILDGMTNEEQAVFLKWMKGMLKSHDVTFINVNHVRKSGGGQKANSTGADLFEEDMQGSSSIFKSGACNLLFTRNKEAEDEIERNTTRMKASKIRWTGKTGVAGEYFYDNASHTMFDKDDYLAKNGTKEF